MTDKKYFVYILFNKRNGTLYTGITSDLVRRIYEHKNKLADGFTKKYSVDKLGYFEIFNNIIDAINREKQIKAGSRKVKIDLIESTNSNWNDLYYTIIHQCHCEEAQADVAIQSKACDVKPKDC